MPRYELTCVKLQTGEEQRLVLAADNERHALKMAKKQGLQVTNVKHLGAAAIDSLPKPPSAPRSQLPNAAKQYRVEVVAESSLAVFLLGSAQFPTRKLQTLLNKAALSGWSLEFMVTEQRRSFLIFASEAVIVTLSRPLSVDGVQQ